MNQLIIARERETIGKMTDKNENTGMILLLQLLQQFITTIITFLIIIIIIIMNRAIFA